MGNSPVLLGTIGSFEKQFYLVTVAFRSNQTFRITSSAFTVSTSS